MAAERQHDGLLIHRPWLAVDPARLRQSLRQPRIRWLEDPSNLDCSLWRNAIRRRLFPAMQAAGCDPQTLFLRWQQQAVRIARQLEQAAMDVRLDYINGEVRVVWRAWMALSAPVRAHVLQRMMAMLFDEGVRAGRRHIMLVETWTLQGGFGGVDLSRCRLERKKSYLHLRRTRAMLR
jgi:tRNA(Ile)-lysidine synthase